MSELYTWNESYSVGIGTLDDHHKKLFSLINSFHTALLERRGREVIEKVIEELYSYTQYHFSKEEEMMKKALCTGIFAHKQAHTEFLEKIKEYQTKVAKGMGAFITADVMRTLNDWLVLHIARMDKLYREAMERVGIQ